MLSDRPSVPRSGKGKLMASQSILTVILLLALPACDGGAAENQAASNLAAAGPDAPASEAELADDAALANEAAADEAADIENYGGNAAAMPANGQ